jgi:hypothetical protein
LLVVALLLSAPLAFADKRALVLDDLHRIRT